MFLVEKNGKTQIVQLCCEVPCSRPERLCSFVQWKVEIEKEDLTLPDFALDILGRFCFFGLAKSPLRVDVYFLGFLKQFHARVRLCGMRSGRR